MTMKKDGTKLQLERVVSKVKPQKYVLHLYIAGLSPRSQKAIRNLRDICNEYLPGRYDLVITDNGLEIKDIPVTGKD